MKKEKKKYTKDVYLTEEQYNTIYSSTFDNTCEMMNKKGVYDIDVIRKMTDIAVFVAMKKLGVKYNKKGN